MITVVYVLSIFLLPWLIPKQMMNHLWNPYSLLHIPLYGILMVLLSIAFHVKRHGLEEKPFHLISLLWPGGIALLVGILDEVNQMFIPGREASLTDVLLNGIGIGLAFFGIYYGQKRFKKHLN